MPPSSSSASTIVFMPDIFVPLLFESTILAPPISSLVLMLPIDASLVVPITWSLGISEL
jgi:hypothetical protein